MPDNQPNLKPEFLAMLAGLPAEVSEGLAEALEATPGAVSVRLNAAKAAPEALAALPEIGTVAADGRVPWCTEGLYLPHRPDFTHLPAMHQGAFYVQDASSMFIAAVVRRLVEAGEPVRYLDACAAPGGKTTAALSALPAGSLVVANEYDFRRAEILKENVQKWGMANVVVSRGDTSRFRRLDGFFDIVATDVPCSGEGMMRKDPEARTQWSPRLVEECAARQRQIIENVWPSLRPGGYLIYSTCTFNRTENEDVVAWIIDRYGAEPVPMAVDPSWGIVESDHGVLRFLPSRLRGEGLFVAVLRKPGEAPKAGEGKATRQRNGRSGGRLPDSPFGLRWAELLSGDFSVMADDARVTALPAAREADIRLLLRSLDVIHAGVEMATLKGRSAIPSQSLALAVDLRADLLPSVEVDLPTAMAFLRRESLPGFAEAPRGALLLRHTTPALTPLLPLGFVNNLHNRSNNLYPTPWRILH